MLVVAVSGAIDVVVAVAATSVVVVDANAVVVAVVVVGATVVVVVVVVAGGFGGGLMPGAVAAPNDHPSTVPGAGTLVAPPTMLYDQEPPRSADQ